MKRTTYGADTLTAAALFLQSGEISLGEISRRLNVPKPTLHRWKTDGVPAPFGTSGTDTGTAERLDETDEKKRERSEPETTQNAIVAPENAVQPVPQPFHETGTPGFFARHFSRMDCVFYVATGTACFAFWNIAPGIPGVCFAVLYWLLAFDALQRVKAAGQNESLAESAKARVWGLEAFAAVAHWNLINEYLWRNLDKLPFEVKQVPDNGVWILDYSGAKTNAIWQNGEFVSMVAALLACSICAAVIVAVGTTFLEAKNQSKSQSKN